MRKILFWLHLIAGISAGIVILIMCVTGVLLTYEKQIIAWADGDLTANRAPSTPRVSAQTLLGAISAASGGAPPTTLTYYSGSAAASGAAGGTTYYVNAYTGELIGTSSTRIRSFFRSVTEWHRYVALSGDSRPAGKAITGASNLIFLLIVITGPVIWWRSAILWFRKGLKGKALFFNWHNVFGLWATVPLFFVVLSATVISYPWASNLVYTLTGTEAPAQAGGGGGGPRQEGSASGVPEAVVNSIDDGLARVDQELADWKTIAVRVPNGPDAALSFNVDRGSTGQPQHRSTITFDRKTGEVAKIETFADQNLGRRTRSWLRYIHTGEYYGVIGQAVAGIASFAGVMLVGTGFALSLQRMGAWIVRRRRQTEPATLRDACGYGRSCEPAARLAITYLRHDLNLSASKLPSSAEEGSLYTPSRFRSQGPRPPAPRAPFQQPCRERRHSWQ